jgi:hypothetical protein
MPNEANDPTFGPGTRIISGTDKKGNFRIDQKTGRKVYEGEEGYDKLGGYNSTLENLLGGGTTEAKGGANSTSSPSGPALGDQLASEYQRQLDRANESNEKRYQDILGEYGSARERALSTLDQVSNQDQAELGEQYNKAKARADQNLINRGLYNTTAGAVNRGIERAYAADKAKLSDSRLRERIGLDLGTTRPRLDFMERRNDVAPDFGQLAQLAYGIGQGGAPGLTWDQLLALAQQMSSGLGRYTG